MATPTAAPNIYSMGTVNVGGTPSPAATTAPVNSNPGNTGKAVAPVANTATPASQTPTVPAPAVFTGAKATDFLNQSVIPTMNNGQQAIATQTQNNADAAKVAADTAAKNAKANQPVVDTTNTTAIPGQKIAHDANGNGVPIPLSAKASDYNLSDVKPQPLLPEGVTVTDTVTKDDGSSVKQLSNGNYIAVDAKNNPTGQVTQADYTDAQGKSSSYEIQQEHSAVKNLAIKMDQITNGTFPLSASQQAQVESVKQSLLTAVAQQEQANQNFTGGTTIAMNLYGMGNSIAGMGTIKGTVDAGIAKITDLQNKAAATIAQMTSAFQNDNMAMLKSAYEMHMGVLKQVQDQLNIMQKAVTDKVNSDRTYNLDVQKQKDLITNEDRNFQLNKDQFTEKQVMDKANLAMERIKVNLEQQKTNAYVSNLRAKTASAHLITNMANSTGGVSAQNADGTFNASNWTTISKNLPPAVADVIYKMGTYTGGALTDVKDAGTREQYRQILYSAFPKYDPDVAAAAKTYKTNFSNKLGVQQTGGQINVMNQLTGHLQDLLGPSLDLNSSNIPGANSTYNWLTKIGITGDTKTQKELGQNKTLNQLFSGEELKFVKGAVGGEAESNKLETGFAPGNSHSETVGSATSFVNALNDKLGGYIQGQKSAMGGNLNPNYPIITPANAIKFYQTQLKLDPKADTSNIVDILNANPEGQVALLQLTSKGQQMYDQGQSLGKQQLGRPLTNDELMQYVHATLGTAGSPLPMPDLPQVDTPQP